MAKKSRSRRQKQRPAVEDEYMLMMGDEEESSQAVSEETEKDAAVVLPPQIVGSIVWYLSALDSARLEAVCRSWAATVSRRLSSAAPHILAFRSTATHRRAVIVEPPRMLASSRRAAALTRPAHRALERVTRLTECLGTTASGRLVFCNTRRTVLFNPVSGTFRRIKKFPGHQHVHPMPVVPIPGTGGDTFFHAGRNEVGVWRAGDDAWTVRNVVNAESMRMAALRGGSVFVLDADGYVFEVALPSLISTKLDVPSLTDKHHTALVGAVEKGYLVAAGGGVHFVWPLFGTRRVPKRDIDPIFLLNFYSSNNEDNDEDDDKFYEDVETVRGFDVYRLDVPEKRWVKQANLPGDTALFVSRWSSFPVRASEKGCLSNCVYFVCDEDDGNKWGAFSLAERRILFEHDIGTGSYKERLWFYPRPREPEFEDMDRRLAEIGYI